MPVQLPPPKKSPPAAKQKARQGGGQRKRKLTEQKKEAVTGAVFMLCRSGALQALEQVPEAVLRSRKEAEEARAAQREFARGHCVVMVSSLLLYGVHV